MDSLNTRRIVYFSLVLTLIVIVNYLSNTKFKRFSLDKNLTKQKSRIDENAAFDLQKTTPRSITKKQRKSKSKPRKKPAIQRSNRTRSYYHSKEEIELTKTFKIQPKNVIAMRPGSPFLSR